MEEKTAKASVEVTSMIACLDEAENIWVARVTMRGGDEPEVTMAERTGIMGRQKAQEWADREAKEISDDVVKYVGEEPESTHVIDYTVGNGPG